MGGGVRTAGTPGGRERMNDMYITNLFIRLYNSRYARQRQGNNARANYQAETGPGDAAWRLIDIDMIMLRPTACRLTLGIWLQESARL